MASEDTLIGNDLEFRIGDGNSPETFTAVCSVFDFGQIGEDKPLIDVTSLCDAARTYRNGLADGVEFTLQANYIPGDTQLQSLYTRFAADSVDSYQIGTNASVSPEETFTFDATVRAWNVVGTVGEKSILSFTLKISGGVTWAY